MRRRSALLVPALAVIVFLCSAVAHFWVGVGGPNSAGAVAHAPEYIYGRTPARLSLATETADTSTTPDRRAGPHPSAPGLPFDLSRTANIERLIGQVQGEGAGGSAALAYVPRGRWELSFDKASQSWRSPGGLIYGQGSAHGNRVKHVLAHGVPDTSKPFHSVFSVGRKKILPLVDEAWAARGAAVRGDPGAFVIPMGRTVGTANESAVKIIVRPGTSEIITAYSVIP